MRATYIVCYDIRNDKRLRQVAKVCENHGTRIQYSVFECDLNPSEKLVLESELEAVMHCQEDQILFIHLGAAESRGCRDIQALGQPYLKFDHPCYIV